MTADQFIEDLEWYLAEAKRLKQNGEDTEPDENGHQMDWGSLLCDIVDNFRFEEIDDAE